MNHDRHSISNKFIGRIWRVAIGSDGGEAETLNELKHQAGFDVFNNLEFLKTAVETIPRWFLQAESSDIRVKIMKGFFLFLMPTHLVI